MPARVHLSLAAAFIYAALAHVPCTVTMDSAADIFSEAECCGEGECSGVVRSCHSGSGSFSSIQLPFGSAHEKSEDGKSMSIRPPSDVTMTMVWYNGSSVSSVHIVDALTKASNQLVVQCACTEHAVVQGGQNCNPTAYVADNGQIQAGCHSSTCTACESWVVVVSKSTASADAILFQKSTAPKWTAGGTVFGATGLLPIGSVEEWNSLPFLPSGMSDALAAQMGGLRDAPTAWLAYKTERDGTTYKMALLATDADVFEDQVYGMGGPSWYCSGCEDPENGGTSCRKESMGPIMSCVGCSYSSGCLLVINIEKDGGIAPPPPPPPPPIIEVQMRAIVSSSKLVDVEVFNATAEDISFRAEGVSFFTEQDSDSGGDERAGGPITVTCDPCSHHQSSIDGNEGWCVPGNVGNKVGCLTWNCRSCKSHVHREKSAIGPSDPVVFARRGVARTFGSDLTAVVPVATMDEWNGLPFADAETVRASKADPSSLNTTSLLFHPNNFVYAAYRHKGGKFVRVVDTPEDGTLFIPRAAGGGGWWCSQECDEAQHDCTYFSTDDGLSGTCSGGCDGLPGKGCTLHGSGGK